MKTPLKGVFVCIKQKNVIIVSMMTDKEFVTENLIKNNMTISFMESCTSGLLASMFTDTQGASAVFKGSFVTYSNEAKLDAGVDETVIQEYGVYSKECAREMARVVKEHFNVDIAVGITGTTGNVDPNNMSTSVEGEAYYCIILNETVYDYHIKIDVKDFSRVEIKNYYANDVYNSLRKLLEEMNKGL